jgi:hypothetical protein
VCGDGCQVARGTETCCAKGGGAGGGSAGYGLEGMPVQREQMDRHWSHVYTHRRSSAYTHVRTRAHEHPTPYTLQIEIGVKRVATAMHGV